MIDKYNFTRLEQWLAWLEQAHPITDIELGLERVSEVAKRLNLLKTSAPVITVAGTNGKGSVVASLEALAEHHQLAIGSYTSPHLINFNERIKLSGQQVSEQSLIKAFVEIAKAQADTTLTYFEFTTLIALFIFSEQPLDLIVLEVGLGGRLDAVNIIDADVSIITSIGLDHTDWLGDDLQSVGREKAGIMRKGRPCVLANYNLKSILAPSILSIEPQLVCAQQDYHFEQKAEVWDYSFGSNDYQQLAMPNLFIDNFAAALTAWLLLFPDSNQIKLIAKSAQTCQLVGRFQRLCESPLIILDVAHNKDSANLLNQKLSDLKASHSGDIWAICGMLKDKDIAASVAQLELVDHWLAIDLETERGASADLIIEALADKQANTAKSAKGQSSLEEALALFLDNSNENDLLLVFGSFVTVALMLQWFEKNHRQINSLA